MVAKNIGRPSLTEEEVDLQKRRGKYYRKLLVQAVGDMVDGVDPEKIGILLSGGVDSTTVLWALLEHGIRPHVYTFHLPSTPKLSTDGEKAKHLAEKYRLPFRLVELTSNPDELARLIMKLSDDHSLIETRPDFEVIPIFHEMIREARDFDGIEVMFSGIADGNVHLVGRKQEIRARKGRMGVNEADGRRGQTVENGEQTNILCKMSHNMGVSLALPLAIVATMQPYYRVPWLVMNTPRLKEITIGAWEAEETASGIKTLVAPLQNGDSGGRTYYDSMITNSEFASAMVGRPVTSAVVFYNALRARYRVRETKSGQDWWDWFGYVTEGIPLPEGYKPYADEKGRAILPKSMTQVEEQEDSLFGDILGEDTPEYHYNDKGELDTRIDCLGNPFYLGPDEAFTTCERAQASLCGKHHADAPFEMTKCDVWNNWFVSNLDFLEGLSEASSGQVQSAYAKWAVEGKAILESIEKGFCNFS